MLGHAIALALLAALPAAEPETTADRTAPELRAAVHDLLRSHASASGAERDAALVDLAALYRELAESRVFSDRAQRNLLGLVRGRLRRASDELQQQLAGDEAPGQQPAGPARQAVLPPERQAILAQMAGNPAQLPKQAPAAQANANRGGAGGAFGAAGGAGTSFEAETERNAQALVDLIQNTISPASWDIRGGNGSIRYFSPKQVLVVRQTDQLHDQIGAALRNLRGGP